MSYVLPFEPDQLDSPNLFQNWHYTAKQFIKQYKYFLGTYLNSLVWDVVTDYEDDINLFRYLDGTAEIRGTNQGINGGTSTATSLILFSIPKNNDTLKVFSPYSLTQEQFGTCVYFDASTGTCPGTTRCLIIESANSYDVTVNNITTPLTIDENIQIFYSLKLMPA